MLIKELKIYSSNVKAQMDFYEKILGLSVISFTEENVSLTIGDSVLNIEFKQEATPYHFAINIPSNKEEEALGWMKSRVDILKDGKNEIQDFEFWNAKSIYFYDKDDNVVELIARKNLNNSTNHKFDANQLLEISEIGLPTLNIEKDFNQLTKLTGIEMYDGGFERFCAIGDERGMFICVDRKVKGWFPTNDEAFPSEFEIKLVEKEIIYQIKFKDKEIKVVKLF
jgi:catechol-2,3-dioxygenase